MPNYDLTLDVTLTKNQAKNGGFSNASSSNNEHFRSPSNSTNSGHFSGYHEAAVTTDFFNFLRKATDNKNGTHTLTNVKGYFSAFSNKNVNSTVLKYVLDLADGFRTDTARTVLSGRDGFAAGHSGSGLSQVGQAKAHNLLRNAVMPILMLDPAKTPGLTKKSIAAFFGAITIASMAPGVIARKVTGTLKDKPFMNNWEGARNIAKRRLDAFMKGLETAEVNFTVKHVKGFMDEISGSTKDTKRTLTGKGNGKRARSEDREETQHSGKISGGNYFSNTTSQVDLDPPEETRYLGYYFTQPFRAERR